MSKKSYLKKLKDPRWQKRRLEILERDGWQCQSCGDTKNTLHVHHTAYFHNCDPWLYPDILLITLCEECHESEHNKEDGSKYEVYRAITDLKERGWLYSDIEELLNIFHDDFKTRKDFFNFIHKDPYGVGNGKAK